MATGNSRKDRKVLKARNTIIAFISLLVILILAFGTYVSTNLSRTTVVEAGEDYQEVENSRARRSGDPIEVIEFFSYACVHCKTFDPVVDEWAAQQADDIEFRRMPASFGPIQTVLAQAYVTFEGNNMLEDNHSRMFRAIHDARRQFLTPEMVADYVDGRGLSRGDFLREFRSPKSRRAMREAEKVQREFVIASTPSLVVAGKYVVSMKGGQRHALDVVDLLISKERAADTALQATSK